MLTVDLIEDVTSPASKDQFEDALEPILKKHNPHRATVEVVITDDKTMQTLNLQHRGIDKTTDVLSLPTAIDTERGTVIPSNDRPIHLGTIVISLPQAVRQVGTFGDTLNEEILELAAHSLRHLLGHDHDDEGEWHPVDSD